MNPPKLVLLDVLHTLKDGVDGGKKEKAQTLFRSLKREGD